METTLVKILSWPFAILGFVYQFIAGSFYSGRILSTIWIGRLARNRIKDRISDLGTAQTADVSKVSGLH